MIHAANQRASPVQDNQQKFKKKNKALKERTHSNEKLTSQKPRRGTRTTSHVCRLSTRMLLLFSSSSLEHEIELTSHVPGRVHLRLASRCGTFEHTDIKSCTGLCICFGLSFHAFQCFYLAFFGLPPVPSSLSSRRFCLHVFRRFCLHVHHAQTMCLLLFFAASASCYTVFHCDIFCNCRVKDLPSNEVSTCSLSSFELSSIPMAFFHKETNKITCQSNTR